MDAVLEQALKLACLIRDSEEANAWREAWNALLNIQFGTPNIMAMPLEEIPLVEHIGHLRVSEQSRPLMFPLLITRFPLPLNAAQIRDGLKDYPEVWRTYQQLVSCFGLTCLLVTFLRSAGPGYPHKDLVYTLPNTPWVQLSSMRELPWNMGEFLVPEGVTDARFIGLQRFVPSVAQQSATSLNDLLAAIKCDNAWLELEKSYETIQRRRNLRGEISRAQAQFQREFGEVSQMSMLKPEWQAKAKELVRKVYAKRGPRIQAYAKSFLEYERLIERIYWLISQILIHESVSCLTSSASHQLQQVSLRYGQDALLTALAPTLAKTLQVGQLVHIELVETEHLLDGLYQVEQWLEKYEIATGARILFGAQCLWYCQFNDLLTGTKEFSNPTFIPAEVMDILGESRVSITGPDGEVVSWRIRDEIPSFELSKTMYLP